MTDEKKRASMRGRGKDIMRPAEDSGQSEEEFFFENDEALENWLTAAPPSTNEATSPPSPAQVEDDFFASPDFESIFDEEVSEAAPMPDEAVSAEEPAIAEVPLEHEPMYRDTAELEQVFTEPDPDFDEIFAEEAQAFPDADNVDIPALPEMIMEDFGDEELVPPMEADEIPDFPDFLADDFEDMPEEEPADAQGFYAVSTEAVQTTEIPGLPGTLIDELEREPAESFADEDVFASPVEARAEQKPYGGHIPAGVGTPDELIPESAESEAEFPDFLPDFTEEPENPVPYGLDEDIFASLSESEADFTPDLVPDAEAFAEEPILPFDIPDREEAYHGLIVDDSGVKTAPREDRRSPRRTKQEEPEAISEAEPATELPIQVTASPVPPPSTEEGIPMSEREGQFEAVNLKQSRVMRGALAGITPTKPEELPPGQRPASAYIAPHSDRVLQDEQLIPDIPKTAPRQPEWTKTAEAEFAELSMFEDARESQPVDVSLPVPVQDKEEDMSALAQELDEFSPALEESDTDVAYQRLATSVHEALQVEAFETDDDGYEGDAGHFDDSHLADMEQEEEVMDEMDEPTESEPVYRGASPSAQDYHEDDDWMPTFEEYPEIERSLLDAEASGAIEGDILEPEIMPESTPTGSDLVQRRGLRPAEADRADASYDLFARAPERRLSKDIAEKANMEADPKLLGMLVNDDRIVELFEQIEALQDEIIINVRGNRQSSDLYQEDLLYASNLLMKSRENYDEARTIVYRVRADLQRERKVEEDVRQYTPKIYYYYLLLFIINTTMLGMSSLVVGWLEELNMGEIAQGFVPALFGMYGALFFSYRTLNRHINIERDFDPSQITTYLTNPPVGWLTGFMAYLLLWFMVQTSMSGGSVKIEGSTPFPIAFALAAGYYQDTVTNLLDSARSRFNTTTGSGSQSSNKPGS